MYILKSPSIAFKGQNAWEQFLSTHPTKECDTKIIKYELNKWNFNPRTPQKSATAVEAFSDALRMISIHAPYKRVRLNCPQCIIDVFIFQSTHPTRECDPKNRTLRSLSATFQSTHPTRECDLNGLSTPFTKSTFQSTHPTRECDIEYYDSK